jgi:hypothetical protein
MLLPAGVMDKMELRSLSQVHLKREIVPVIGPVVALRVGRGIALLFHDRGTSRG